MADAHNIKRRKDSRYRRTHSHTHNKTERKSTGEEKTLLWSISILFYVGGEWRGAMSDEEERIPFPLSIGEVRKRMTGVSTSHNWQWKRDPLLSSCPGVLTTATPPITLTPPIKTLSIHGWPKRSLVSELTVILLVRAWRDGALDAVDNTVFWPQKAIVTGPFLFFHFGPVTVTFWGPEHAILSSRHSPLNASNWAGLCQEKNIMTRPITMRF